VVKKTEAKRRNKLKELNGLKYDPKPPIKLGLTRFRKVSLTT